EGVGRRFELAVGDTFGCHAPFIGLPSTKAARPHDDVLCAGYADHLLEPGRPAGTWDLAKPLLRQRVEAGLRDHAKIAGEHQFEPDPETKAAAGGDHRLSAARPR